MVARARAMALAYSSTSEPLVAQYGANGIAGRVIARGIAGATFCASCRSLRARVRLRGDH